MARKTPVDVSAPIPQVSAAGNPAGIATEATLLQRNNAFATLQNFQPYATTNRMKRAPPPAGAGFQYLGRNAVRNAAESSPTWEVVRMQQNTVGEVIDSQYKANIAWTDRTNAAHWEA